MSALSRDRTVALIWCRSYIYIMQLLPYFIKKFPLLISALKYTSVDATRRLIIDNKCIEDFYFLHADVLGNMFDLQFYITNFKYSVVH